MSQALATFCTLFNPLKVLGKYRYKVMYGGRSGMKTEHCGLALLWIASQCKCRILCTREVQNSIEDSVYQTLVDIINLYNLNYHVTKNKITHNKTGSQFSFKGLQQQTINSVKSFAKADICWIEEAQSISEKSWDILINTIRQKHSEIWVTFNPDLEDDYVYKTCITEKLHDAWILNVNYNNNPWFEESPLYQEMLQCKKNHPTKYRHIWLGEPISNFEANVYRFDRTVNIVKHDIKYNQGFETVASFDFGISDDTAILFYQLIPTPDNDLGFWIDIFDEIVNNNVGAEWYRDAVDSKEYLIERFYCDPAGASRQADLSTWIDKLKRNPRTNSIDWHFEYTHKYSQAEMLDLTNDIVPYVRYNQHQCPHFHKMAFHWQYKTDKDDKVVLPPRPDHNEFSHVGDSFKYFAINRFPAKNKAKIRVLK